MYSQFMMHGQKNVKAWRFVCCECRVLSGRGPYVGADHSSKQSCREWRV